MSTFKRLAAAHADGDVGGWMKRNYHQPLLRIPVMLLWLLAVGVVNCGALAQQQGEEPSQAHRQSLPSVQLLRPVAQQSHALLKEDQPERTPEKVIVVIHRLSGWKLLAWLAQSKARQSKTQIVTARKDERLNASDAYTNIVAGCVLNDGHTVVARLPQAATEAEALGAVPVTERRTNSLEADDVSVVVVRRDGTQARAKFVGFDAATGLSLLHVDDSLLASSAQPRQESSTQVGQSRSAAEKAVKVDEEQNLPDQPVRLFAPQRVGRAEAKADTVYLRLSEVEGRLVNRQQAVSEQLAPEVIVSPVYPSAEIDGAVALSTTGEFVGIVERNNASQSTHLVPVNIVRQAAQRVLARRTSVPQPWLGARGDAVAMIQLTSLTSRGWPPDKAFALMRQGQGVLLTGVPSGTPAALAGLRAGDVVAQIGEHPVRSVDDFSQLLKQFGANVPVQFTIWRAESAPRAITVKLSAAFDPVKATKMALQLAEDDGTPQPESSASYTRAVVTLGFEAVMMLSSNAAIQPSRLSSLLVTAVRQESAAAISGLRPGDLIVSVNGKSVEESKSIDDLFEPLDLTLGVIRHTRSVTLTLSRRTGNTNK